MNLITMIGLIAAACTTIAFLPQAIKTIKSKNIAGLSLGMYTLLVAGIFLWLVYGILIKDPPVIFANAITLCFCVIILFFIIKYRNRQS